MARVFVSHARKDLVLAREWYQWLIEAGHKVFLAHDLRDGITVGEEHEHRTEMLRLGVPALIRQLKLSRSRVLPVQLPYPHYTSRSHHVPFPWQGSISLGVSRKYMRDHLNRCWPRAAYTSWPAVTLTSAAAHNGLGFGMDLLVLTADSKITRSEQNMADYLWK